MIFNKNTQLQMTNEVAWLGFSTLEWGLVHWVISIYLVSFAANVLKLYFVSFNSISLSAFFVYLLDNISFPFHLLKI